MQVRFLPGLHVLPHSKIGVKVPTWRSVLAIPEKPRQRGRGVLPDFYVPLTWSDFMSSRDAVKELASELTKLDSN